MPLQVSLPALRQARWRTTLVGSLWPLTLTLNPAPGAPLNPKP